jgi:hypothetical protein
MWANFSRGRPLQGCETYSHHPLMFSHNSPVIEESGHPRHKQDHTYYADKFHTSSLWLSLCTQHQTRLCTIISDARVQIGPQDRSNPIPWSDPMESQMMMMMMMMMMISHGRLSSCGRVLGAFPQCPSVNVRGVMVPAV